MAYADVKVFFMSGTGNSFRVARVFAEESARAGADVEMAPMGRDSRPRRMDGGGGSHVMLATPTHGFTAPWLAIWFALHMPRGRGAHCSVIATRAGSKFGRVFLPGLDGTAAYVLALIMAVKGYSVRGAIGIDMPSNWIAVHPGFRRESAEAIIARSRPTLLRFTRRMISGRRFYGSWISLPLGIALIPVSLGYLLYGRAMFGKLFFSVDKCDGCGVCARHCQHHAIRMRGKPPRPYWTWRCESCFRCMCYCPKDAIEVSHSLAVIMGIVLSFYPPLLAGMLFGPSGPLGGTRLAGIALPALNYAFWLGMLMLVYAVFWGIAGWKPVNAFFRWTTLTRLWRRYHEPGTKLADMVRTENFRGKRG